MHLSWLLFCNKKLKFWKNKKYSNARLFWDSLNFNFKLKLESHLRIQNLSSISLLENISPQFNPSKTPSHTRIPLRYQVALSQFLRRPCRKGSLRHLISNNMNNRGTRCQGTHYRITVMTRDKRWLNTVHMLQILIGLCKAESINSRFFVFAEKSSH